VLRHLAGEADQIVPAGVIVAADDMPPSTFLATDWREGGLVLRRGSPSSHVAILARSRGVPMIVGVDIDRLDDGSEALLDGDAGLLIVDPDTDTRTAYCQRRAEQAEARKAMASFNGPAHTATGEPVRVMINVTGLAELATLDPGHVDGIGLMRTEFLFHGRDKLPTEEEQYRIYRRMLEWAGDKPVTIRTLDAGGDKPIAGLTQPDDMNPFLGVRGVRLSLRRPEVFRAQLRALGRAAVVGNLKVMIPMVTVPEELDRCRALFEQACDELRREGVRGANAAARHDGRGAGGGVDHRGLQRRLLLDRQQRSHPVCGGREPGRTAARRSHASFARRVRPDPPRRELCQPRRARSELVRRSCGRSRAGRSTSRSGFAHLLGRARRARPGQGRDRLLFRSRGMSTEATPAGSQDLIAAYKAILRDVLDKRPSGMRQRLAEALGKNRSFITQIANPAYQTPIPAQHVHPIIQICHFSAQERDRFLEAYHRAHPRRLLLLKERERSRRLTLMLPDLGSEQKNRKLDALLSEFAEKVARLIEDT
jgi:phosphohistidine swiveling domain-containing protein